MHHAHLFNHLGIRSISGDEFMAVARGQVRDRGLTLNQGEAVESVEATDDGFRVVTGEGEYDANYFVLATGDDTTFAEQLDCAFDGDVVDVDVTMETSVENAYATGAMVRNGEYEAVISAGDGGAAALNILLEGGGRTLPRLRHVRGRPGALSAACSLSSGVVRPRPRTRGRGRRRPCTSSTWRRRGARPAAPPTWCW